MSMIFFTYRAATQARMGASILRSEGIPVKLGRSPARISRNGCGYGLSVPESRGREAAELLRREGQPYMRSYLLAGDRVREVQL